MRTVYCIIVVEFFFVKYDKIELTIVIFTEVIRFLFKANQRPSVIIWTRVSAENTIIFVPRPSR